MTAQDLINLVAFQLKSLKISDTTVAANNTQLLHYLNMAKNDIARDTLIWLGGETVAMTTANTYTLTVTPLQVIDVYDSSLNYYLRNNPGLRGYYQTGPATIHVNNPSDGDSLYFNYYYCPTDYTVTDTLDVHPNLVKAMIYNMTYQAYDVYKGQQEQAFSKEYLAKYTNEVQQFLSKTDSTDVDTITGFDPISIKGLV